MKIQDSMFSTSNTKIKLPSDSTAPTLRCLLNGPLNLTNAEHRITPVHDVVFLDEVDPDIIPLNYRPIPTSPEATSSETENGFNGTNGLDITGNGEALLKDDRSRKDPNQNTTCFNLK
nr:uncharacterized protein LOC106627053 isoform X1 [Bactrocera oleae]